MQELNVRELSLATEDSQYGVRLQGEPDNERLGKRLKGDFKKVCDWLSLLANIVEKIISTTSIPRPPPPSPLFPLFPSFLPPPQHTHSPMSFLIPESGKGGNFYEAYSVFLSRNQNLTLHVCWLLCVCYRWLLQ